MRWMVLAVMALAAISPAQLEEAKRLAAQPQTTSSSWRLLELTQYGDRPTRLFLLDKWGEVGRDAVSQAERIVSLRFCQKAYFPIALSVRLRDIANGTDAEAAKLAVTTLARLAGHPGLRLSTAGGRCGVYSQPALPFVAEGTLKELKSGLLKQCFLGADAQAFDGLAPAIALFDRKLIQQEAVKRLDSPSDEERAAAGFWYTSGPNSELDPDVARKILGMWEKDAPWWVIGSFPGRTIRRLFGPDVSTWPLLARRYYAQRPPKGFERKVVEALLQDSDPDVRAVAIDQWELYRIGGRDSLQAMSQTETDALCTSFLYRRRPAFGSYAELVGWAKNGSGAFIAEVISEAKTLEEFQLAIDSLGERALAKSRGQEAEALWKFWPASKPHIDKMFDSPRWESRCVAAVVILRLDREKIGDQLEAYVSRIAADENAYVRSMLFDRGYSGLKVEDIEGLVEKLFRQGNREIMMKALESGAGTRILNLCAEGTDPQLAEYARAILKR